MATAFAIDSCFYARRYLGQNIKWCGPEYLAPSGAPQLQSFNCTLCWVYIFGSRVPHLIQVDRFSALFTAKHFSQLTQFAMTKTFLFVVTNFPLLLTPRISGNAHRHTPNHHCTYTTYHHPKTHRRKPHKGYSRIHLHHLHKVNTSPTLLLRW